MTKYLGSWGYIHCVMTEYGMKVKFIPTDWV